MTRMRVCRWRGDYGAKKQLWFPSNYVEEIDDELGDDQDLGAIQQDSISLAGVTVGTSLAPSQASPSVR